MLLRHPIDAQRWCDRVPTRGRLVAIGVVLALAGCATSPPSERARVPAGGEPVQTSRPSTDGAPERPPADLLAVPDAEPQVEPIRPGGPNKPYVVLGQAYEPVARDEPIVDRGLASWYGTKFHGRRTASGETYSMYGMSAAHRTLPIPSYVKVRNVRNGKEVIVRVNDRGPFHGSRVIDLSYTAAAKLDILARGTAEVEVTRLTFEDIRTGRWRAGVPALAAAEPVPETDPIFALASRLDEASPVPLDMSPVSDTRDGARPVSVVQVSAHTPAAKGFWVQLAAFGQRQGVDAFQKRVADELGHLAPLLAVFNDGRLYRLQVGPYGHRDEAQSVAGKVRDALQLVPMIVERR